MKKTSSVQRLTQTALIAALYAVLTLLLPVASFGTVQLRFSEILTVLPCFSPTAIGGLTLGCALSNAVGVAMGANVAGVWDVLFGTAATFVAAVGTRALRRVKVAGLPLLSVLMPVIVNAGVIGAQLCVVLLGEWSLVGFGTMAASVGLGQVIPCVFGGLFVYKTIEKTGLDKRLFMN